LPLKELKVGKLNKLLNHLLPWVGSEIYRDEKAKGGVCEVVPGETYRREKWLGVHG